MRRLYDYEAHVRLGESFHARGRLILEQCLTEGGDDWSGPGDADVVALATGLGASEVPVDDVEGELRVDIEADDEGDLSRLVATADDFAFELELADHGEPVEVDPPTSALPFEQLGR